MAETSSVENRVCNACQADVRPQALFCYNCGKSVAPDLPSLTNNGVSGDLYREDILQEKVSGKKSNKEEQKITVSKVKSAEVKKIPEKLNIHEQAKLNSAAALRNKTKAFQRKRVEIVWEENENAPNALFIFVTILLVLFAVAILIIAMYLR